MDGGGLVTEPDGRLAGWANKRAGVVLSVSTL